MIRPRLLARALVVAVGLAGCAAIADLQSSTTKTDLPDADVADDAGTSPRDAAPTGDDAREPPDTSVPIDSSTPCTPALGLAADGIVHAKAVLPGTSVDGVFTDWACVDKTDVGPGAFSKNLPPGNTQALRFAFQWSPTNLYFYAKARTTTPGIENLGNQIFRNDSVHLFIGPFPAAAGGLYRLTDHQYVFDHAGRTADYDDGVSRATGATARVVATSSSGVLDFEIEAVFVPGDFGLGAFAVGSRLLLNLQMFDTATADASSAGYRIWRLPMGTCTCDDDFCCARTDMLRNSPTCDLRCSESLLLE